MADHPVNFSSQWKQVTVLFADLSIPPGMVERTAEETPAPYEVLRSRLEGVIRSYGGTVESRPTQPDEPLMALFGVPRAGEDDPERAIRAALTMQATVALFPSLLQTATPHIKLGISTSLVLVNPADQGRSYSAMGHAVNIASHLSATAAPDTLVISQDTHRHVAGIFDTELLPTLSVSGVAAPIARLVVQGERPRTFRTATRGVQGIDSPMIGREEELARLKGIVRRVGEQQALHVVSVVGEAGVGKSRLLHELAHWLEGHPLPLHLCKGRADAHMSSQSYALMRDLFAFEFGIREGDRAVVAQAKLEQGVRRWMGERGIEKAHVMGQLLGFDFSQSPYLQGVLNDARQVRDRAFHYAALFFAALTTGRERTQQGPLVILFLEDIHWADEGSLRMIEYIVQACRDVPMLLLCTARLTHWERHPEWGQKWPPTIHSRLELGPLSHDASRQLLVELLRKVRTVPPALEELIVRRADGNPFYIEELVKMLLEDGVIERGETEWRVALERLESLRIPPTLTGVLQARLDALPPQERELIQRAAVVGQLFWDSALAQLGSDRTETIAQIRATLDNLQKKGLVIEQPTSAFDGTREYTFQHALLQEVAYDGLLKRRRQWCHAQIAGWLMEQGGERVAEYAGQIGLHYEAADKGATAVEWYGWAARQARATHAPQAAIDYYRRAIALLPATPAYAIQRLEMLEGQGEMLWLQARYEEAILAYVAMRQAAQASDHQAAQARSWEGIALVQGSQGQHAQALESGRQAEAVARQAGSAAQAELAGALTRIGTTLFRLDELPASQEVLEQALALSTSLNARPIMARSLNILGWVHSKMGHYEQARHHLEQALGIFRDLHDRRGMGVILNNLGWGARARGDHRAAIPLYREALSLFQETGDRGNQVMLHHNLGGALVGAGEYGAAEAELRQSIQIARATAAQLPLESHRFLAEALLGQGLVAEAWEAAHRALEAARAADQKGHLGSSWRVLALVLLALTEPPADAPRDQERPEATPEAYFARSLQLLEEAGDEREQAQTLRAWARYAWARGEEARGRSMWESARQLFERLGMNAERHQMDEESPRREEPTSDSSIP